ncbi:MAG TPA: hypothetical protein VEX63_03260, partial [Flavisolibacter sp.]|nr:hypothetical protein [Flavisolibacter sp.]
MKKPIMQWLLPAVIGFSSLTACKKDKDEPISTPTPTPPVTASAADKVKDTTLLYARDAYLWYTQ